MSESTIIQTKYGNARLNDWGYYTITTRKEGNHHKLLHRVIFEDFYNIKLDEEFPEGIHIHHIDGNKTNNEIWNLEPIPESEHMSLHNSKEKHHFWGKSRSDEIKEKIRKTMTGMKNSDKQNKKISQASNTTGFYRVIKRINKKYKQGFLWTYVYYEEGKKRQTFISSVDLLKLKQKVIKKGLEWVVIDEEKAKKTIEKCGYDLEALL